MPRSALCVFMKKNVDAFSRRHPAVNFLFFALAILFGMLIVHPAYVLSALIAASAYLIALFGSRGAHRIAGLIPVWLILSAINPLFNTYGETVLFHIGTRPYTLEALLYGAALSGAFMAILVWFMCYQRVMTGDKFTLLFGNAIPALSLLLVMVFRLVALFQRKATQISVARRCVGFGTSTESNRMDKVRDGATVLGALTGWALENSVVTADSMRARGYGTAKRSSFRLTKFEKSDLILTAILVLTAVIAFICAILGAVSASYSPSIQIAPVSGGRNIAGLAAYNAMLWVPVLCDIREEIQWRISISKI